MADRVYSVDDRPRDTIVVERDADNRAPARGMSTGAIVAIVIVVLVLLFLLLGRPF